LLNLLDLKSRNLWNLNELLKHSILKDQASLIKLHLRHHKLLLLQSRQAYQVRPSLLLQLLLLM